MRAIHSVLFIWAKEISKEKCLLTVANEGETRRSGLLVFNPISNFVASPSSLELLSEEPIKVVELPLDENSTDGRVAFLIPAPFGLNGLHFTCSNIVQYYPYYYVMKREGALLTKLIVGLFDGPLNKAKQNKEVKLSNQ